MQCGVATVYRDKHHRDQCHYQYECAVYMFDMRLCTAILYNKEDKFFGALLKVWHCTRVTLDKGRMHSTSQYKLCWYLMQKLQSDWLALFIWQAEWQAAATKKVASLCATCILTYNIVTSVPCLPQLYRGSSRNLSCPLMVTADSLTMLVWF